MFRSGDKLTYHGRRSGACDIVLRHKDYGDSSEWVFVDVTSSALRKDYGRIIRCYNPTSRLYKRADDPMSFYEEDFELTRVGPEPYEEWFR